MTFFMASLLAVTHHQRAHWPTGWLQLNDNENDVAPIYGQYDEKLHEVIPQQ